MAKLLVTEKLISAHVACRKKAFLQMYEDSKSEVTQYSEFIKEKSKDVERQYRLATRNSLLFSEDNFTGVADVIFNANFASEDLVVEDVHLQKRGGASFFGDYYYEPLTFSTSSSVTPSDRAVLHYVGLVLSKVQEVKPNKAAIVLLDGKKKSIRLDRDSHLQTLNEIEKWVSRKPEAPDAFFIKHCQVCCFKTYCQAEAEKDDSIKLLGDMPEKVVEKYQSKGIFTVKQLSYLYKPRRRSRHWGERKPTHQYELQALALRTQNIYTDHLLEFPKGDVRVFVDIESVPDKEFHYLIGVLVVKSGSDEYYSLWAEDKSEERRIFSDFINIILGCPDALVFHYGNYERKSIRELGDRHSIEVSGILDQLVNVNEFIYGRIYFPTRSNRLKDICQYLGYKWSESDASGLNSIIWRHNYDRLHDPKLKERLVNYNKDDCFNLRGLANLVNDICSHESAIPNVKAADDNNQLLSSSGSEVVNDFTALIKSAHGKYEQSKISHKKKSKSKSTKSEKERNRTIPKYKVDKEVRVSRGRVCPLHKRALIKTDIVAEAIVVDLISTPRGIKKTIIRYWGYKGRCPNCSHRHNPPALRRYGKNSRYYGVGLKAWITYQRLAMRLPFRKISQLLEDSFNIEIASGGIGGLLSSFCQGYNVSENKILSRMLTSPSIHADETLVNIQGKIQYVWVFTDGERVIFRLTPTRNSEVVHKLLKGYDGVLISDFFAGYEAVECVQQKCWVHLIRDINEDLRKSPFDVEFDTFVTRLRDLVIPIFEAVDKYGLKKRNLNKFIKKVDGFFKAEIACGDYDSESVKKYQKRLSKHKDSLFVFLERDGIAWNNNMAERALRHLAVQRKISGSFFASAMEEYLIMLGIMQTCRFQNKPFLEFLMSGELDIDLFQGKRNIRGWTMR